MAVVSVNPENTLPDKTGISRIFLICSICTDDMDLLKENTIPCGTCNNIFHVQCVGEWVFSSNNYTCPLCRSPFSHQHIHLMKINIIIPFRIQIKMFGYFIPYTSVQIKDHYIRFRGGSMTHLEYQQIMTFYCHNNNIPYKWDDRELCTQELDKYYIPTYNNFIQNYIRKPVPITQDTGLGDTIFSVYRTGARYVKVSLAYILIIVNIHYCIWLVCKFLNWVCYSIGGV